MDDILQIITNGKTNYTYKGEVICEAWNEEIEDIKRFYHKEYHEVLAELLKNMSDGKGIEEGIKRVKEYYARPAVPTKDLLAFAMSDIITKCYFFGKAVPLEKKTL